MNFEAAVLSVPEIADCLRNGLQALGSNSKKVKVDIPRKLDGSVDIDDCLKERYPNAPRWDYVFGYNGRLYYLEVHPSRLNEVKSVVAKFEWLKQWRKSSAQSLENLKNSSSYHWVSSGTTTTILPGSRQRKLLDQRGIFVEGSVLNADVIP